MPDGQQKVPEVTAPSHEIVQRDPEVSVSSCFLSLILNKTIF